MSITKKVQLILSGLLENNVIQFKPKAAKPNYDDAVNAAKQKKLPKADASHLDVTHWINHAVKREDGASITSDGAYDHYVNHCAKQGANPVHPTVFHSTLRRHGIIQQNLAGRSRYIGLSLNEAEDPFKPYKRKNPNGTKTKGFTNKTKYGSHVALVRATESQTKKGSYTYGMSVNGRRKPNSEATGAVQRAFLAKHGIRRLSNLLQTKNPASVDFDLPIDYKTPKEGSKRIKEIASVLAAKHGYEYKPRVNKKTGTVKHSLVRKHSW